MTRMPLVNALIGRAGSERKISAARGCRKNSPELRWIAEPMLILRVGCRYFSSARLARKSKTCGNLVKYRVGSWTVSKKKHFALHKFPKVMVPFWKSRRYAS